MINPTANNLDAVETTSRSAAGAPSRQAVAVLRTVGRCVIGLLWVANAALLIAGFVWVYGWGTSRGILELVHRAFSIGSANPAFMVRDPARLEHGVAFVEGSVVFVGLSLLVMFASLLCGPRRFRTTRVWLMFTGLTCGWLGLAMTWPTVYWIGQQHRMSGLVSAAESLTTSLQSHWPAMDGELPEMGPFLAYPGSAPTALLPLDGPTFPETQVPFSAVERTGNNVMRFELSGREFGAWLEWRGDASEPRSFVGGLETRYDVDRATKIAPHWYLVRYRANLAASG